MKIEIEPKDIKFKIQVGEGKFKDMAGSLIRIKGHEVKYMNGILNFIET